MLHPSESHHDVTTPFMGAWHALCVYGFYVSWAARRNRFRSFLANRVALSLILHPFHHYKLHCINLLSSVV